MKSISWIVASMFLTLGNAYAEAPTYSNDAFRLLLDSEPMADLSDAKTQSRLVQIDQEINALKIDHLTESGQKSFFPNYAPYSAGQILIKFSEETQAQLAPLFNSEGKIDLASNQTGLSEFDSLNQSHQATELRKGRFNNSAYTLIVGSQQNLNIVAKSYSKLSYTKFAEPNRLGRIGESKMVRRMDSQRGPGVYVFSVGWGDCPAGCIASRRFYFETAVKPNGAAAVKIGEAGIFMEPAAIAVLFKN